MVNESSGSMSDAPEKYEWPHGYTSCLTCTFDVDASVFERRDLGENVSGAYSAGDYGPRCGLPRILNLAAKYDVKCTFFWPGWVAERFPEMVKECHKAGHDVAAHGYLHEKAKGITSQQAIRIFRKTQQILGDLTGTHIRGLRPCGAGFTEETFRGWYELGWRYAWRDWKTYYPCRATIGGEEVDILVLPMHTLLDDANHFWYGTVEWFGRGQQYFAPSSPQEAAELWLAEFEDIHNVGGVYTFTCHPRAIGRPTAIKAMEAVIQRAQNTPGVWIAPVSEIAEWVLRK